MADVYKFKVKLVNLENVIWRDIEITSVSNVAKLGYSILAAFESTISHLFAIEFNGNRYEILFEDPVFQGKPVIDPIRTKLSSLNLTLGDILIMEYDYGAGWEFSIELISVSEMKRGTGTHYPYVTDGKGKGIIEDYSPYELVEIVKKTDEGLLPKVFDEFFGEEKEWDYRNFDLTYCNTFFKDNILRAQYAYEVNE